MLGFLQRVHKLAVKDQLERTENNDIRIPQKERHLNKDGIGKQQSYSLNLSNQEITEALLRADIKAKENIEKLQMVADLKKNKQWDTPTITPSLHNLALDDGDNDEEEDEVEAGDDKKCDSRVCDKQEMILYHQMKQYQKLLPTLIDFMIIT